MKKYSIVHVILFGMVIFFTCEYPQDPIRPDNAIPRIEKVDGKTDSLSFKDGETVLVQTKLILLEFMDSLVVTISDSDNVDTQFTIKENLEPSFSFKITFTTPGRKELIVSSHNKNGIINSDTAIIFVECIPIKIISKTHNVNASKGENVVIGVEITGSKPIFGNWYHNGDTLINESENILHLENVSKVNEGIYYFVAKNECSEYTISFETELFVADPDRIVLIDDTVTIDEDSIVSIYVFKNDTLPENTKPRITYVSNGKLGTIENFDSMLVYTPDKDIYGKDTVVYSTGHDTACVYITILPVQDEPLLNCPAGTSVQEEMERIIIISAYDPDGDDVTLWLETEIPFVHSEIDGDSLIVTISPEAGIVSEDSLVFNITVKATDNIDTVEQDMFIVVFRKYRKPAFITHDTLRTITEGDNITILVKAVDYNGNTLQYSVEFIPDWVEFKIIGDSVELEIEPGKGTVPEESDELIDSVIIRISNGIDTVYQKITVTVIKYVNRGPVFKNQDTTIMIVENESKSISISAYDPDGDIVTLWHETEVPFVHSEIDGDSLIVTISPEAGIVSGDSLVFSVTVKATDNIDTVEHEMTVVVFKKYRKPEFITHDTLKTVTEGDNITILVKAVDYNGKILRYSVEHIPDWVRSRTIGDSVELKIEPGKGTVPEGLDELIDSVIISISNGIDTVYQKITVFVAKYINSAPVFDNQDTTITIDENESISVVITAHDENGDSLIYFSKDLPDSSSFENNIFTWTPSYEQAGIYTIVFEVTDGTDTVSFTMSINVNDVNRQPLFENIPDSIIVYENKTKIISIIGIDADNDDLFFTVSGHPSWVDTASYGGSITLTIMPAFDVVENKNDTVRKTINIEVSDGTDRVSQEILITVINTNQPPIFSPVSSSFAVQMGRTFRMFIEATDLDAGDLVTLSVVEGPEGASFIQNNLIGWHVDRSKFKAENEYELKIRASDGTDATDTTFYITVESHEWNVFYDNITASDVKFSAADSTKIFYGTIINGNKLQVYRYNEIFHDFQPIHSVESSPLYFDQLQVNGDHLHILHRNYSAGFYRNYNYIDRTYDSTMYGNSSSAHTCISRSGSIIHIYSKYQVVKTFYYKTSLNTFATANPGIDPILIKTGEQYGWALDGNGELYVAIIGDNTFSGYEKTSNVTGFANIFPDSSGTTVYARKNNEAVLYRKIPDYDLNSIDEINIRDKNGVDVIPFGLLVLNKDICWMWDESGNLYFTNDGFVTINKEKTENGGIPVPINGMFLAENGKTVFAYSKDGTGKVVLLKY